jgi:hypothetical protein
MKQFWNYYLLIAAILAATNLFAQEKSQQIIETGRIKSFASINLLSPLNFLNPRIGAGFVYGINERWKVGVDIGYGNKSLSFIDFEDEMGEKYQLWEIRPELYYFISPWKKHERYFSTELFYINHKDVFYGKPQYDQADYRRYKSGFHLKYGMIIRMAKHLELNLYTGFGLRIRSNTYSNEINPVLVKDSRDFHIGGYKDFEEVKTGVDFSLGLKLVVF